MAFFGDTNSPSTDTGLINMHNSIFDWLTENNVRWRVYHDGLSFFALYPACWKYVLSRQFRDYENLAMDMLNDTPETAPQVILIEPSYQSAPHVGSDRPNDNHAPLAMGWGEEFLRRTYEAVRANKKRWAKTIFTVYYDEHGGFYDHVAPPAIKYTTIGSEPFGFKSLGPRIPAIVASPFVKPGTVCHELFDHTSVLQMLAERFTPGKPYSATVNSRKEQGIKSLSVALTQEEFWEPPAPPAVIIQAQTALGMSIAVAPNDQLAQAFETAANNLLQQHPVNTADKYPELYQWKEAVNNARPMQPEQE